VQTPSIAIAGGFKGVGECGTIGAAPAIAAGIEAAMPDLDITIKQVPMTASRIQRLITDATTGKA
jgi:CO/xanthine dehydrogenase Mo-binding subunit